MNELVTVVMLCYNHANWVEKALEGVVSQKTNFKYIAIVHDDASTDDSRKIIDTYAKQYPEIIRPIYQSVNQYSQGVKNTVQHIYPKIRSKYVAYCECDDFWIDTLKLQKQVDFMEKNPECTFCFSNSYRVDLNNRVLSTFLPLGIWNDKDINFRLKSNKECDFNTDEMLRMDFIPTASTFCRFSAWKDQIDSFGSTLDLLNRIFCTYCGYAHYFPEKMVAYRTGNALSASGRAGKNFESLENDYYKRHKELLDKFDLVSNGAHHKTILRVEERKLAECYVAFGRIKEAKRLPAYRDFLLLRRIKNFFKRHFGSAYKWLQRYIQKMRQVRSSISMK